MTHHTVVLQGSCLTENQTSYPRMHPANQRPGKPDKLAQGAHKQTSYCRVQWGNTLDKRGSYRTPVVMVTGGEEQQQQEEERDKGEHKVKEQSGI